MKSGAARWIALACLLAWIPSRAPAPPSTLSITLNTNAWNMGRLVPGSLADTWFDGPGAFAVSNNGSVAVDLTISVTNEPPSSWQPSDTAGSERFAMRVSRGTALRPPRFEPIASDGAVLTNRLPADAATRFDLQFAAPTATAQLHQQHNITLTIIAVESE